MHLADPFQPIAGASGVPCGGALTAAVERQHRGARKRRSVKSAGSMRQMVRHPVPAVWTIRLGSTEAIVQMMWSAAGQVARSIDNGRQEQWIPGGCPFLGDGVGARLQ